MGLWYKGEDWLFKHGLWYKGVWEETSTSEQGVTKVKGWGKGGELRVGVEN